MPFYVYFTRLDRLFDVPPHVFHSIQAANKARGKGIAATRRWESKKGLTAGSDTNENKQRRILYGNREMDWQRRGLYTPYIKSAPCDVCQCNMRGERHKSVLKSSENKMVFERKMERGAAEIV